MTEAAVVTRFAPSPTGRLHVGNVRIALVNWLVARRAGGRFVLRFDDTDRERSRPEFAAAIEDDLRWLGLGWDACVRQSERGALYEPAFAALVERGRIYPCYESEAELAAKRAALRQAGRPPIYDRAALSMSDADRQRLEVQGLKPHWRFRLAEGEIAWDDLVRGPTRFEAAHLSDPVIRREDGTWLYLFPSVADDADLRVSHVIRGEDHVANTAAQIQMADALGAPRPRYAHLPLLTDLAGRGLSKRTGSVGVADLREGGIEPMAILSLLAGLGSSDAIQAFADADALAAAFDLSHVARAAPKFDPDQLVRLNARLLHELSYEAVRARLAAWGADGGPAFWAAVRGNLERLADAKDWHAVCFGEIAAPSGADPAVVAAARADLPAEPWDEATWGTFAKAVGAATGLKGRALYQPLRLVLTGRDHGPEMKLLLPLIGRARAIRRLDAALGSPP